MMKNTLDLNIPREVIENLLKLDRKTGRIKAYMYILLWANEQGKLDTEIKDLAVYWNKSPNVVKKMLLQLEEVGLIELRIYNKGTVEILCKNFE